MRSRSDPGRGFGPQRYPGSFVLAFGEAASGLGWRLERLERAIAHCTDARGEPHALNLEPLYERARRTPRTDWPQLAADFLRSVEGADSNESKGNTP